MSTSATSASSYSSLSFVRISCKIGANIALIFILYVFARTGTMLFASGDPFQTLTSSSLTKSPTNSTDVAGSIKDAVTHTPALNPCALPSTSTSAPVEQAPVEYWYIFGIDIYHPDLYITEAVVTAAIISAVLLPQLYITVKLIQSTNCETCPPTSIQLAFAHRKIQFVTLSAELILSKATAYYLDYSWYESFEVTLAAILWKFGLLVITGIFIDKQVKKVVKENNVIVFSTASKGITIGVFGINLPEAELVQALEGKAVVISV